MLVEFKFPQICRGTDNVCISRRIDIGPHTEMPHIIFLHFRMQKSSFILSNSSALQYRTTGESRKFEYSLQSQAIYLSLHPHVNHICSLSSRNRNIPQLFNSRPHRFLYSSQGPFKNYVTLFKHYFKPSPSLSQVITGSLNLPESCHKYEGPAHL